MRNSPEGNFDLGKWTVIRRFRVLTNDLADGPMIATNAVGIPFLYQTYTFGNEGFPLMRCRSITPKRDEANPLLWMIECRYETADLKGFTGTDNNAGGGTGTENPGDYENPLLELAEIETRTEKYEIVMDSVYDLDTQMVTACKNSAGEKFDPPPMKEESRLTLTITRNEPMTFAHPYLDVYYKDAVNSDAWGWGLQPGQAKMKGITAHRVVRQLPNGTPFAYLRVSYVMDLKPDWDLYILDAGHFYMEQEDPLGNGQLVKVPKEFKTDDQHPRIGLLDGKGNKLPGEPQGGTPVFVRFRPYRRIPFGLLNLPTNWAAVQ